MVMIKSLRFSLRSSFLLKKNSSVIVQSGFCSKKLSEKQWPYRVFSGIQPTGTLHLGNYFGAVSKWVNLQNTQNDVIFSIVDLHSITLPQDPKELHSSILGMTASLIACGIDPQKCILFQQSKVPQHALLGWVLGTMTTLVRLYHFPQYKEKSAALKDVPLGLFIYPVLQAADILLYKATHVPVGDDQLQHLHLAQHLVHTFNNKYGLTFPVPDSYKVSEKTVQVAGGDRIRSLREPEKKMSKSHRDHRSRLEISDSPELIRAKVRRAVTDCTSEVSYLPEERPGVSNLIALHSLATGCSVEQICREAAAARLDTGKYKLVVAEALIEKFSPIRSRFLDLLGSPEYLEDVLNDGAEKAQEIAEKTWAEVSSKIGFDKRLTKAAINIAQNS